MASGLRDQLRDPSGRFGVQLVSSLAVAAGAVLVVAVGAGIAVSREPSIAVDDVPLAAEEEAATTEGPQDTDGPAAATTEDALPGDDAPAVDASDAPSEAPSPTETDAPTEDPSDGPSDGPTQQPSEQPSEGPSQEPSEAPPSPSAGDRTGVTATSVEWGVHAPATINGAPLNIAEDPLNGIDAYLKYINDRGGIHGRQLIMNFVDDGYTVDYARRAADVLINEQDNFIVSGTLGVDQIAVVAAEAQKRGVPYMAAGGSESHFISLDIHQYALTYNEGLIRLAEYLSVEPRFQGKNIGVTVLDSPLFDPAMDDFLAAAEDFGVNITAVEKIQKPDQQTSYISQIQGLKEGEAEVVIPVHDPVSTSRIVAECRTQLCTWDWTYAGFVHDTDTALALMQGEWTGVRGLSSFCSHVHPNADDPSRCAAMGEAHRQWAEVRGEDDWQENGQSGSFGYQAVSAWVGALRAAGEDLTRERWLAALHQYDDYADLITGPITFAGRSTYAHGAEEFVILEAQSNLRWLQLSDGLQSDF